MPSCLTEFIQQVLIHDCSKTLRLTPSDCAQLAGGCPVRTGCGGVQVQGIAAGDGSHCYCYVGQPPSNYQVCSGAVSQRQYYAPIPSMPTSSPLLPADRTRDATMGIVTPAARDSCSLSTQMATRAARASRVRPTPVRSSTQQEPT